MLCGVQSSDAVNGATGVALAGYLELPHVAVVKSSTTTRPARPRRSSASSRAASSRCSACALPALLTIQTGINEPRYANLRAIKQAREKPLEVTSPDELGLDAGAVAAAAGSRRRELKHPERGEGAEMIDGSPAEVAARIVEIVRDRMSG